MYVSRLRLEIVAIRERVEEPSTPSWGRGRGGGGAGGECAGLHFYSIVYYVGILYV